jgi:hypothetical protein
MPGSVSDGRNPIVSNARKSAAAGSTKSATTTAASGCTGPPRYTGSSAGTSDPSGGTASATVVSDARFKMTPTAPSSS